MEIYTELFLLKAPKKILNNTLLLLKLMTQLGF